MKYAQLLNSLAICFLGVGLLLTIRTNSLQNDEFTALRKDSDNQYQEIQGLKLSVSDLQNYQKKTICEKSGGMFRYGYAPSEVNGKEMVFYSSGFIDTANCVVKSTTYYWSDF